MSKVVYAKYFWSIQLRVLKVAIKGTPSKVQCGCECGPHTKMRCALDRYSLYTYSPIPCCYSSQQLFVYQVWPVFMQYSLIESFGALIRGNGKFGCSLLNKWILHKKHAKLGKQKADYFVNIYIEEYLYSNFTISKIIWIIC